MSTFSFGEISSALSAAAQKPAGVDFSGEARKLDTEQDAKPIVDAIASCERLEFLNLMGNTLGVDAAKAVADALKQKPEFKKAIWSDMFTGRMKTEIPKALTALGDGMIHAGARLTVLDLSDNAFGPIGVEGLANLITSAVCNDLQELRLNNNGLGITGGNLLAKALLRNGNSKVPRLKVFIAGRNRLEDNGAKALAQVFKTMGSLEEVSMPQNGIYHSGITELAEAFKVNHNLHILNLNDNTIGPKGAEAIANALPNLRSLREVNFGDCLLKNAGATALAEAIRTSGVSLECLDLSHNEIGSSACAAIASALESSSPGVLRRVSLAGNMIGNAAKRRKLKELLGDAAVLNDEDDDGSDDDDEDSDESSEEESEEEADSTANSTNNTNDSVASYKSNGESPHDVFSFGLPQPILDLSTDSVTEIETPASKFLSEPTFGNFLALGPEAANILEEHLKAIKDPADIVEAHVSTIMKLSSLVTSSSETVDGPRPVAVHLYKAVTGRAGHGTRWILGNSVLVSLGLIKSEKKAAPSNYNLPGCLSVLSSVINEKWFPDSLRDTIKFFIKNKMEDSTKHSTTFDYSRYPGLC